MSVGGAMLCFMFITEVACCGSSKRDWSGEGGTQLQCRLDVLL